MNSKQLNISNNPVEKLAEQLEVVARESIEQRGRFSVALSGGSTPKALYQLLASSGWKERFNWENIDIVFGDERAVAPDDELSNFRMARLALLDHVPSVAHRMEAERDDLEGAASDYEASLKKLSGPIDVVLLGMGDDGHTASLFPHSPQLDVADKWVTATPVATLDPHVRRLTLTFPAINAARHVWFLISGEGKADRLKDVFESSKDIYRLPSQGIEPDGGELTFFLDEAAAKLVS